MWRQVSGETLGLPGPISVTWQRLSEIGSVAIAQIVLESWCGWWCFFHQGEVCGFEDDTRTEHHKQLMHHNTARCVEWPFDRSPKGQAGPGGKGYGGKGFDGKGFDGKGYGGKGYGGKGGGCGPGYGGCPGNQFSLPPGRGVQAARLGNLATQLGVLPGSKCLKLMQLMTMSSFEESDVCIQER